MVTNHAALGERGCNKVGRCSIMFIYPASLLTHTMSNTNETQNTNAVEQVSTKNDTPKKPIVKSLSFDKLEESQQLALAEKVASEKKPHMDAQLLLETLQKNGIQKVPSQELVNIALEGRRQFATGTAAYIKAKDKILETYNQAIKEGFTPQESRKIVVLLVTQNGKILSDRTVRNYLPAEAKATQKAHAVAATPEEKAEKQAAAEASTIQQVRQFIIPVNWVNEIVNFAKKHPSEACLLVLNSDNSIRRISQAVISEEIGKDGKPHKVTRPTPEANNGGKTQK